MTLIAGIILPNGILMISDSRAQIDKTEEVYSEYTRKITMVTPTNILGTSGHEPTFYAAQTLRQTLFKKDSKIELDDRRSFILDLYKHINLLHLYKHDFPEPVGHILLGELNLKESKFSLLSNYGSDNFKEFTVYNKIKDIVVIGAYSQLRDTVEKQIQDMLVTISEDELNHKNVYARISIECHKIFKEHAAHYDGINDKLYCVHLSTIENDPSAVFYFLESDGSDHVIDSRQDGVEISYTE
ncbi:hypothetical protein [Bacillus cereus]|uniref:hypothetical protein n=1 Tax=Bacillus cereus TaxID=1396 RepID=UPI0037F19FB9